MKYEIRAIKEEEIPLLEEFLYEAIYVPEGVPKPPKNIINNPELRVYWQDFGKQKDDYGLFAEIQGKPIGTVWARIMNDYGHIDDETPSLALAVHEAYRGRGIGTALLRNILERLEQNGYRQASLSVQRANPAFRLYRRLGFVPVDSVTGENAEECIMKYVF